MSSSHQSVPPVPSSHTEPVQRHVIRITRLSLVAVLIVLICTTFPALGWPAAFGWLVLLPIAGAAWIIRTRTTVTPDGLETQTLFSSGKVPWSEIKGVRFPKRGWARADLGDGREAALPAVTFDRIRELAAASGGRIPDPYAARGSTKPGPNAGAHQSDDSDTRTGRE